MELTSEEVEQNNSTISKRIKRSTSATWEEFERIGEGDDSKPRARCIWCSQLYVVQRGYGTSNLLKHLHTCGKRARTGESTYLDIDQDVYRQKVATAIIKHNHSFSFMEHEGNRDIHSYLNPKVKHISRNTAKSDVIKVFAFEKERVMHVLRSNSSRICLTSDLWSSITTDHYMAVTGHYVDENWELQKKILCFAYVPPPYGGIVLAEKLLNLLKEWGIDKKIFTITLDNAAYNGSMVEILKRQDYLGKYFPCEGGFFHVRWGVHILNLIVHEGLKVACDAIDKIRESVKYVRGSAARKMTFAKCILHHSLSSRQVRQDVPTRWNSTYMMIETALLFCEAFDRLSLVDLSFSTCPTKEDWDQAERIKKLLKPFF